MFYLSHTITSFTDEILRYSNFDLENIFTPVDADKLHQILTESDYDSQKTEFLVKGFKEGFSLGYQGSFQIKMESPNLKIQLGVGSELELWNKVMKEVKAKRYAGPYEAIPFDDHYIQSPIGLVPKDGGKNTRLIFHLSYPRNGSNLSVNSNTPKEMCTVKYPDFSKAVQLCLQEGKHCKCSKSDWKTAFRHFPILSKFWNLLVMKAKDPETGKWWYFVDKCMPFGSSISCSHFQKFSDAIAHVMRVKTGKDNVNYLDDFLFIALLRWLCNHQTSLFMEICETIHFPVALEKTCWATTLISFLGMLIDTSRQLILIPREKIAKALAQIDDILNNKKSKTTVLKTQKICGLLNFLCRAIVPGRPFIMRMYGSLAGFHKLKPYHHIRVSSNMKRDLGIWRLFLSTPEAFSRPFMDFSWDADARMLDWYTDAAKGTGGRGMGGSPQNTLVLFAMEQTVLTEHGPKYRILGVICSSGQCASLGSLL